MKSVRFSLFFVFSVFALNTFAQSSILLTGRSYTQQGAPPTPCSVSLGYTGNAVSSISIQGWGIYSSMIIGGDNSKQYTSIGETYALPNYSVNEIMVNANVARLQVFTTRDQKAAGYVEIMHSGRKIVSIASYVFGHSLVCTDIQVQ